jgi:transposase-like protein
MNAWHRARETWTTAHETDIASVVEHRLPDHGLTRLGRRIAARQLLDKNVPVNEIAQLIGVDPRTVYRWRREERAA